MHCLLIFFSWGLLAPKPLGVFRYRLLSYTSTWDCSSMLNLRTISLLLYLCSSVILSPFILSPLPVLCSRSSVILSSFTLSPPPVPCSRSFVILSPFTLSPPLCPSVTLSPFTLSLLGCSVYRIVLTIRKGNEKQDNSVYYC